MNLEKTTDQHAENMTRLAALIGDNYDGMEMQDYMSYLNPEKAKQEIDLFEKKINAPMVPKEELIRRFKAHLEYLAA